MMFKIYPSPNGDSVCIDPDPDSGEWNECYLDLLPGELKRLAGADTEPPASILPSDCIRFDWCVVTYDGVAWGDR